MIGKSLNLISSMANNDFPKIPGTNLASVPDAKKYLSELNIDSMSLVTTSKIKNWPVHFPEENCPPSDSFEPDNLHVIRVLVGSPPSREDFLSWTEEGHPDFKQPCQSCGISVYLHPQHLLDVAKRIPALRGRSYAGLKLDPTDGKVLNTPSKKSAHHHTWWKSKICLSPESRAVVAGIVPSA